MSKIRAPLVVPADRAGATGRLVIAARHAIRTAKPESITHRLADIIRWCLLMIAAGYVAGSPRSGPLFKMALDLEPSDCELCSPCAIDDRAHQLVGMERTLHRRFDLAGAGHGDRLFRSRKTP
ncbi:hypothetical protein [Rhodoblastus sp.]|uniref:hypothetical protein n=1 Tax=Rhodoblastus sp. TaxID=1962975 RepID=UPI003FD6F22E